MNKDREALIVAKLKVLDKLIDNAELGESDMCVETDSGYEGIGNVYIGVSSIKMDKNKFLKDIIVDDMALIRPRIMKALDLVNVGRISYQNVMILEDLLTVEIETYTKTEVISYKTLNEGIVDKTYVSDITGISVSYNEEPQLKVSLDTERGEKTLDKFTIFNIIKSMILSSVVNEDPGVILNMYNSVYNLDIKEV